MLSAKRFWQNKHKQGFRWAVIYFYRRLFSSQTTAFQEHDMENIFRMRVRKTVTIANSHPVIYSSCAKSRRSSPGISCIYIFPSSKHGHFELVPGGIAGKDVGNGALS